MRVLPPRPHMQSSFPALFRGRVVPILPRIQPIKCIAVGGKTCSANNGDERHQDTRRFRRRAGSGGKGESLPPRGSKFCPLALAMLALGNDWVLGQGSAKYGGLALTRLAPLAMHAMAWQAALAAPT